MNSDKLAIAGLCPATWLTAQAAVSITKNWMQTSNHCSSDFKGVFDQLVLPLSKGPSSLVTFQTNLIRS